MKVIHVLLAGATRYDRTCASIDLSGGAETSRLLFEEAPNGWAHEGKLLSLAEVAASCRDDDVKLVHVHGSTPPPKRLLAGLKAPWVCDHRLRLPRTLFRALPSPAAVLAERNVPDAAEDRWFVPRGRQRRREGVRRVGTWARNDVTRNSAEQAAGRIQRFRDDVEWVLFEEPPSPSDLADLDLWVDPAGDENDLDGMVVEALACLTPIVASRTEANRRRLDGGRAGLLPPVGDHNEMTHAVLNVLFKDEVALPLRIHAETFRENCRPARRRAAIEAIYDEVTR